MTSLIILPYLNCPDLTRDAIEDALNQSLSPHLLLIDNGSGEEGRALGEEAARHPSGRVLRWRFDPPLPSLSAVWNRALQFAWEAGAGEALVVNNDLRLWKGTYQYLLDVQQTTNARFVTATGVTTEQFDTFCAEENRLVVGMPVFPLPGPDFSCFLITKACHQKYAFDEGYVPAYVEDVSYHRTLMLNGDGQRIFGTGLPFEHIGSGTLNGMDKEQRARKEAQISAGSRAHHLAQWGGGANEERYTRPFDPTSARDGVTTADLFEWVRMGRDVGALLDDAAYTATPDSPTRG